MIHSYGEHISGWERPAHVVLFQTLTMDNEWWHQGMGMPFLHGVVTKLPSLEMLAHLLGIPRKQSSTQLGGIVTQA